MNKERKEIINKWNKFLDELVSNEYIQAMQFFTHHHRWNVLEHCIHVAKFAIKKASKLKNIDFPSLVRGCLLHDFYLYNWRDKKEYHKPHLKKHPLIAYNNAQKVFGDINEIEKEIIIKHMWPINSGGRILYKETKLAIRGDKACSIKEFFTFWKRNRKEKVTNQEKAFEEYWKKIGGPTL